MNWTSPQIIGPVVAALVALLGVILTLIVKKGKDGKEVQRKQSSILSKNTQQFQAGRDITYNEDAGKKENGQ